MIRCGHCGKGHPSVAKVRECATRTHSAPIPRALRRYDVEADERAMQQMEAEADRAESLRDELAKAAHKASVETWDQPRDAAEFYEQMREGAALSELVNLVDRLLVTREVPQEDWRWSRAVREMITTGSPTEFGLRTAIARLQGYPSLQAKLACGHPADRFSPERNRCRSCGQPAVVDAPAQTAPAQTEAKAVAHEGLYRHDGQLYQVIRTKDGKRLYANLVRWERGQKRPTLTYMKGMVYELRPEELLSVEEAQEITRKTGWCVFGHFLTNPKSIARGMGPKCYERYPHLARNAA